MLRSALVGLGVLAWVVAAAFGTITKVRIEGPVVPREGSNIAPVQSYDAVNIPSAAAALGFSLSGGLCFLAASLADRRAGRE
jgi:hypothetical protein